MIQDWVAKVTTTEKGQKLFQPCDYSLYKKIGQWGQPTNVVKRESNLVFSR